MSLLLRSAGVSLSGFVLFAQGLFNRAQWFVTRGYRPATQSDSGSTDNSFWFVPSQVTVGLVAVALGAGVALAGGEPAQRLLGPLAASLVVAAGVLLVNGSPGRGPRLVYATLALGILMAAELGWAALDLAGQALALRRTVAVVAALAGGTVVYSFGLGRINSVRWATAARRAGPVFGLFGAIAVIATVVEAGSLFNPVTKQTPLTTAPVALVAASLFGLIVAALAFAVRPETDPFRLTDRRRPLYVYAAEGLLLLLFLHLRLSVPGFFPQIRGQYWAFVVMAIAFAGVGLAEFFNRRQLDILVGPLQRTGVFLPLLPLLAFWLHPPDAVRGDIVGHFSGVNRFSGISTRSHSASIVTRYCGSCSACFTPSWRSHGGRTGIRSPRPWRQTSACGPSGTTAESHSWPTHNSGSSRSRSLCWPASDITANNSRRRRPPACVTLGSGHFTSPRRPTCSSPGSVTRPRCRSCWQSCR